jgi:hypothetical protein
MKCIRNTSLDERASPIQVLFKSERKNCLWLASGTKLGGAPIFQSAHSQDNQLSTYEMLQYLVSGFMLTK